MKGTFFMILAAAVIFIAILFAGTYNKLPGYG